MPHKGRPYPFLFPRDLSRWGNESIIALPKKFKTMTGGGLGTDTSGWTFKAIETLEGEWDYDTGKVVYQYVPPAGSPPGTSLVIEYRCTFDAQQWNAKITFTGGAGVPRVQNCTRNLSSCEQLIFGGPWVPNPGLPVFFAFGTGTHIPVPWPP